MKLRHAILGLLSYEPQSGYDLSRAFASSVVNFWYADQSQIYRTLDRLEADGAISTRVIAQTGRPDRRVHSLTPEGRAELDAWLAGPLEPRSTKDAHIARIFFAARLGHEKVDALLEEAAGAIRQEMAALEAIEFDVVDLDTALKAAVLRRGVEGARFELEWIEQIRRDVADDAAKVREAEGRDGEDG